MLCELHGCIHILLPCYLSSISGCFSCKNLKTWFKRASIFSFWRLRRWVEGCCCICKFLLRRLICYLINRIYVCYHTPPSHTHIYIHTQGIWRVLQSCFLFSFYCSSQQLKETKTGRWRTACSPCGHKLGCNMSSLLQQLSYYFHQYEETVPTCVHVGKRRDNCSVCCYGDFAAAAAMALSSRFSLNWMLREVLKASKRWKQVNSYQYGWYLSEGLS